MAILPLLLELLTSSKLLYFSQYFFKGSFHFFNSSQTLLLNSFLPFFLFPSFYFHRCLELAGKPACVFDRSSYKCRCPECADITIRSKCVATKPCPESNNTRSFCVWRPTLSNTTSGECSCCTPVSCPRPKIFNNSTCSCVCPVIKCLPGRVFNPTTCQCDCPRGTKDIGGKCVGE